MSFWTDGTLEPKRQNRWVIQFDGLQNGLLYYATKVARPQVEVSNKEHKFLNHTFNYPGRATWKPITLTVVDVQGGLNTEGAAAGAGADGQSNAMQRLLQILQESGYVVPGAAALGTSSQTISKGKANSAMKSVHIKMVNADGKPVEHWELKNPFITDFKPSELSYEGEDLATVELTITYDFCQYYAPDGTQIDQDIAPLFAPTPKEE